MQAEHRRAGERAAEPLANEALERAQAQRANGHPLDVSGHAASSAESSSPRRVSSTLIGSRPSRRRANESTSAEGESSHWTSSTASTIGPELGQRGQRVVHCDRQRAVVRRGAVAVEQQRGLERPSARRRELRQQLGRAVSEQVAQACVRQTLLDLGGPGREHAQTSRPRRLDAGQPERRLADPRLAVQHERRETVPRPLDELEQRPSSPSLPTISPATSRAS